MMNYWKKITGYFRDIFDKDREKIEPDPERDWILIVSSFLLGFVLILFFFRYFFVDNGRDLTQGIVTGAPDLLVEDISKAKLEKLMGPWKEKEAKFGDYFTNRPSFDFLK